MDVLQTSDFRLQRHILKQDCRKSKPILSGCVPVDEKYGAKQAEKEEKGIKKEIKKKNQERRTKKKTKKDCGWLIF